MQPLMALYFEIVDYAGYIQKIEAVEVNGVWDYKILPYTPYRIPPNIIDK